jgi:hypothetical protein
MDSAAWELPDPGAVRVLSSQADWDSLVDEYGRLLADGGPEPYLEPFRRCLEVARAGGALSVVTETGYLDADYRSEYSAFYSRGFQSRPDSAHRLHFFKAPLRPEQLWRLPEDRGYLGYALAQDTPTPTASMMLGTSCSGAAIRA